MPIIAIIAGMNAQGLSQVTRATTPIISEAH
jgi:hypothetical protein